MTDEEPTVLQIVPLSMPWPTIDPFLFCVHHLDHYPAGDGRLAPDAPLDGRELGADFAGVDGWRMYHGEVVAGFPAHPHRGFETVTYVRQGLVDHSDSLGAQARFGRGDTQWLTAGAGIVHAEMFPLVDTAGPNTLELFQIWLNLPAEDKMAPPHFAMLWAADTPRLDVGEGVALTVVAGPVAGATPPSPPPRSWASRADADVAIWHLVVPEGASWTLPPAAGPDTVRCAYVFAGSGLDVDGTGVAAGHGAVVRCDRPVVVRGEHGATTEVLILQGRPIGQPVAQQGPFVMNDRAGLMQAFEDYRRTGFGGWPFDADDPVHGVEQGRFARHADGRLEEVSAP